MKYLKSAVAAVVMSMLAGSAGAEAIDNLTIVVPSSPGGGFDQTARAVKQVLRDEGLARTVVVENHPGGGGAVALGQIMPRAGDEGVLLVGGLALVTAGLTTKAPITIEDLTPLARLTSDWQVFAVSANSNITSVADLRAAMEAYPGAVAFGGGAAGSLDHVTVGLFAQAIGVDPAKINYVAHSGGGEVAIAVMGGHLSVGVSGLGEFAQLAQAGQIRILAVLSDAPLEGVEAPTLRDAGIDLSVSNWRSIHAAPGISEDARARLTAALATLSTSKGWAQALTEKQWTGSFLAGPEFQTFLTEEVTRNKAALRAIGLLSD